MRFLISVFPSISAQMDIRFKKKKKHGYHGDVQWTAVYFCDSGSSVSYIIISRLLVQSPLVQMLLLENMNSEMLLMADGHLTADLLRLERDCVSDGLKGSAFIKCFLELKMLKGVL